MKLRPNVLGFPTLAEVLRQAGVTRNEWQLPSAQSLYLTTLGAVMIMGAPVASSTSDVPAFDEAALVRALRADQAGNTTFPQFLTSAWEAGVVRYVVDFAARHVSYYGVNGETYREDYPAVVV
jgi:uncharacterized protein YbcV (DUF1398 family)